MEPASSSKRFLLLAIPASSSRRFLLLAIPVLLFAGLHARTLPYEFVWTDHTEIVVGTLIRPPAELAHAFVEPMHRGLDFRFAGVIQPYFRPLHAVVASVIHAAVGPRARAYRLASQLAGALTVALFAALAWLVLQKPGAAVFAAGLAALHPAGIEVYVWVSGMSQALSALFIVSSLLAALLALRAQSPRGAAGWSAASAASLLLALLSHENGAVTPGLLVALVVSETLRSEAGPLAGARALGRRAAGLLAAHAVLSGAFLGLWRPFALGGFAASGSLLHGSLATQWLSALASWPRAFAWLLLPLHSSTSDRIRIVDSFADPMVWAGVLVVAASAGLALWALRARRPATLLGVAWVWLAYLPAANLIPAAHPWAERYIFLSVFGLALVAADLGTLALDRVPRSARAPAALALAVAVLGLLAQRSFARAFDWRSERALFERDVARDPLYREGRFELAAQLYEERRLVKARDMLAPIVDPSPELRAHASFLREADAYQLDCQLSLELGEPGRALERIRELESRGVAVARSPGVKLCRGYALEQSGRPGEALELYRELAGSARGRGSAALRVGAARSLVLLGRHREAREELDAIAPAERTPQIERDIRVVRRQLRAR